MPSYSFLLSFEGSPTSSDDLNDLIIDSEDRRLTALICDVSKTHEFIKLPVFSRMGLRMLPTQLPQIAGALVELNFNAIMACTFTGDINLQLLSLHVIHSGPPL
jgi:hypothetical protein